MRVVFDWFLIVCVMVCAVALGVVWLCGLLIGLMWPEETGREAWEDELVEREGDRSARVWFDIHEAG